MYKLKVIKKFDAAHKLDNYVGEKKEKITFILEVDYGDDIVIMDLLNNFTFKRQIENKGKALIEALKIANNSE